MLNFLGKLTKFKLVGSQSVGSSQNFVHLCWTIQDTFETICHLLDQHWIDVLQKVYSRKPVMWKIPPLQIRLHFPEKRNKVFSQRALARPIVRLLSHVKHEGGLQMICVQCTKGSALPLNDGLHDSEKLVPASTVSIHVLQHSFFFK